MLLRVIAGSRSNYVLQEQTKIRARVKRKVCFSLYSLGMEVIGPWPRA